MNNHQDTIFRQLKIFLSVYPSFTKTNFKKNSKPITFDILPITHNTKFSFRLNTRLAVKKQLALFFVILLSGIVNAQEQAFNVNCNAPLLFPKQVLSADAKNLDVTADQSEASNGNYLLSGNAVINSAEYYLSADEISIHKANKTSNANGNIKFQTKQVMLTGDKALIKKQDDIVYAVFEKAKFHYPESKINGQAQKIVSNGVEQTFDSITYNLCPVGNTDWNMKAKKVILNQETNHGIAKEVTVEFMGVPIFYSPHHEWALKGRSSGFLAPSFSNYDEPDPSKDDGYQIRIPYYFNIAPDRDFLLTLNQVTTRGSVVEGKYRQLLDKGHIEVEGHYLNKDKISKEKRWLLKTKLDISLNDKIKLDVKTNRVSDKNYFKEISHGGISTTSLQSSVNLAYKNKENNLDASIFAENAQLVNDDEAEYTRAPEVTLNKKVVGLGEREANFSIVSTKFKHKESNLTDKKTGTRTHIKAKFTRNIKTNAYLLKPKFEISRTKYSMDDTTNPADRSIYSFGLDSKLFFEREVSLFGKNTTQTLIPRLAYNYTPGKNQSTLQNFDSEEVGASYEGLFSGKKFTSIDRISKANDVVLGLESDFIDDDTGATYLSLKIARARYLDNVKLGSDGNLTSQGMYSDVVAAADLTLGKFEFNNAFEYDPKTNTVNKRHNTLSYIESPKKFATLIHSDIIDAGGIEQRSAGVYGAYPVTKKIHIFAGINRSLTDSINNKKTTGIAYESCCYAIRLAHFKERTDGSQDNVTKFEFVLKGLASSDSGLAKRLEGEIPNYLVNLDQ